MLRLIIRSAIDIQNLPGYKPRVKSNVDAFKRIIQPYYVRAPMQCALCGTWHNEGYVVELEHGGMTNIGHVCGRSAWLSFADAERSYLDKQLRPKLLAKLHNSEAGIALLAKSVHDLRARALLLGHRKREFLRRFPVLGAELRRRANDNRDRIVRPERRDDAAIDELMALNPRQDRAALAYVDVPVGVVRGLRYFRVNIHEAVVLAYTSRVEKFMECNLATLPTEVLTDWDSWVDSLDDLRLSAEQAIRDGEAFLEVGNITLLQHIAASKSERAQLEYLNVDDLDLRPEQLTINEELKKRLNRAERRRLKFKTQTI